MLTQLQTPIPLKTPKGKAWAVAIIDYGPHWDLQWVTFVQATGECWTFTNRDIRQEENFTFGIPKPTSIAPSYASASPRRESNDKENGIMRPAMPVKPNTDSPFPA